MPKIKTHSGAKKRFSVTGSGKVSPAHKQKTQTYSEGSQA